MNVGWFRPCISSDSPQVSSFYDQFWIGGVVLVLGLTCFLLTRHGEMVLAKREYFVLGVLTPLFTAWVYRSTGRLKTVLASLFIFAAVMAEVIFLIKSFKFGLVTLLTSILLTWFLRAKERRTTGLIFLTACFAFLCSARLPWWKSGWTEWSFHGAVFCAFLVFFTFCIFRAFSSFGRRIRFGPWDFLCGGLLALASFRIVPELGGQDFFLGTLALLKQGGWLLWDTPSQYGFLNLLLTSILPVPSEWQALYVFNSTVVFASAILLYAGIRTVTYGWLGVIFSFLLGWVSVLLAPGWAETLMGPNGQVSVGAYRFLWCYLLIGAAAMLADVRRHRPITTSDLKWIVAIWLTGCFWSFESALLCTAAAGSILALSALEMSQRKNMRGLTWIAVVPALSLVLCWAAVELFYRSKLGHGPDWKCFYEFVFRYQEGGASHHPIDAAGAVVVLIWTGILLLTSAILSIREGAWQQTRWALAPTFLIFFAALSYFVTRGEDNNVLNLAPFWVGALLVALYSVNGEHRKLLLPGIVPLYAGLFMVAFGHQKALLNYMHSLVGPHTVAQIDAQAQLADSEVQSLLSAIHGEPVASFGGPVLVLQELATRPYIPRTWLPLGPVGQLSLLPPERQNRYAERYLARVRPDTGWILEPKFFATAPENQSVIALNDLDKVLNPRVSGLYRDVLRHYEIDKRVDGRNWTLFHFRMQAGRIGQ